MFDHNTHIEVGHLGFTLDVQTADDMYDPPVPSTAVNLYGPYPVVTAAAMTFDRTPGVVIVDLDLPHPCSLIHGCVHATLMLDGHVDKQLLSDAISAVFGEPDQIAIAPASKAHLN
ncbi:hypothetical protein [Krasilnikovia sp. MM14-A1259]|uniref:hypothetical protein n=1 Tax=Krasilnikovia sp. MM14-A1259 TaxID=3373539 RepID=UPI00382AF589